MSIERIRNLIGLLETGMKNFQTMYTNCMEVRFYTKAFRVRNRMAITQSIIDQCNELVQAHADAKTVSEIIPISDRIILMDPFIHEEVKRILTSELNMGLTTIPVDISDPEIDPDRLMQLEI